MKTQTTAYKNSTQIKTKLRGILLLLIFLGVFLTNSSCNMLIGVKDFSNNDFAFKINIAPLDLKKEESYYPLKSLNNKKWSIIESSIGVKLYMEDKEEGLVRTSYIHTNYSLTNYVSLLYHEPITIYNDTAFQSYGFPGIGTEEDPYIIENYNITTSESTAITIVNTTKHFIIKNCLIQTNSAIQLNYFGIDIRNCSPGTVNINNNIIINSSRGVYVNSTDYSTIKDNFIIDSWNGISFQYSKYTLIDNNTIFNIETTAISSSIGSEHSIINNNKISHCGFDGIYIGHSRDLFVVNNLIAKSRSGMVFSSFSSSIIAHNNIFNNTNYGAVLSHNCFNNYIYFNNFISNNPSSSQGYDASSEPDSNKWYNDKVFKGNYWSDGIGLYSYSIDGSGNVKDFYPQSEEISSTFNFTKPEFINIFHNPTNPTNNDIVVISAEISSETSLHSVNLYYRIGFFDWQKKVMILNSTTYSSTIGTFNAYATIYYFVEVVDISGNFAESTIFSFTVSQFQDEVEESSMSYFIIVMSIFFLSTIIYRTKKVLMKHCSKFD